MRTVSPRTNMSLIYRLVMALATPIVRWWGRLTVIGDDLVPSTGPVLLIPNHDSAWDPVVIGVATRRRQVRALAKSSLWNSRPLAWVLDGMRQIPIERGRADAAALQAAIDGLRAGHAIGVFAEGTVSRGRPLRAQSGAGRLALAVPGSTVICVAVTGAVDIVRFPRRPRIRVEFFEPTAGQPLPGESAIALSRRIIADVRARAPYAVPGRTKKAAEFARLAADREAGSAAS
jgi:1-acyl-sn-glycerol-3-phosphate acyltransferase